MKDVSSAAQESEGLVDDNPIIVGGPEVFLEEGGSVEKSSSFNARGMYSWLQSGYEKARLPPKYRLITEKNVLERSVQSVRFAIMASAINTKMLNPNYPIMVTPGASKDSFPNTDPFNFNSATYFLPMCSLLGVAIASVFLGQLSDRVGRKQVLMILSVVSTAGSVVKFFCKNTFWGFCISQVAFGFFLGNLPVGMAYIGDIYTSQKEKEKELGLLVSFFVMGNSGGGIIAILMNGSGLFSPLWVGAVIMGISAVFTNFYMIEAGDVQLDALMVKSEVDEQEIVRPDTIDSKALWNIVGGAVADNFGSTALFPLCLSPLAIEQYLFDFVEDEEEPIMTILGYQWLSVMVAGMVVPSTMMTPFAFRKLGVAGTCVMGNLITALVTFVLLLIGNGSATNAAFGTFVFVMYAGFPFTVFSQLTTGPMLDVIAPEDKIGYVQGLNNAGMNFGMAFAPWLFGMLADGTSTNIAISVGIGVSCLAAAINSPLVCDERFGKAQEPIPTSKLVLEEEDEEFVQKALAGEFVDPEKLYLTNLHRAQTGKSVIVPKVIPYEEDKDMEDLYSHAGEVYLQKMKMHDQLLSALNDPNSGRDKDEFCKLMNAGLKKDQQAIEEATMDLGKWIGDYLEDTGYNPHAQSVAIKQMVLSAFPPIIRDKEYTPENIEPALLRSRQVYNKYLYHYEEQKRNDWSWSDILGTGASSVFYS